MLIAKSAQRLPSPPGPGWPGRTSRASTAPALYEFISHVILHFLPTRTIDSRIRGLTCLRRVLPSVAFADNSTALSDKQNLSFFLFFFPSKLTFPSLALAQEQLFPPVHKGHQTPPTWFWVQPLQSGEGASLRRDAYFWKVLYNSRKLYSLFISPPI